MKYFTERGFYYNKRDDRLSANLFAVGGEKWRNLRTKLSPASAFTPGKIKVVFDLLVQCADQMKNAIDDFLYHGQAIDAEEAMTCYSTDVIASCAFGLDCNSFASPYAEFRRQGKKIFQFTSTARIVKTMFAFGWPNLARWLGVRLFDKECSDFFMNVVKDAVTFREINNVVRMDILQLLIESKSYEKKYKNDNKCVEELAAQVFIFFAAGFEISSITLTFCLYELATHSIIQNRLKNDRRSVLARHGDKITYDAIAEMKYLSQIVDETLRNYPPVPFITRQCVKDYAIPGTDAVLENGIDILISILGLHHDPEYYPHPEKFDPERFSEANKGKRASYTYMPFGEEPKICIGLQFGLMQIKVGLVVLMKNYRFSLNGKTSVPLQFEQFSFTLIPKTNIYLDMEKVAG